MLYSILYPNGEIYHESHKIHPKEFLWFLPSENGYGDWLPSIKGSLDPKLRGYHLVNLKALTCWLGPSVFEAQFEALNAYDVLREKDITVVRKARLLRKTPWNWAEGSKWMTSRLKEILLNTMSVRKVKEIMATHHEYVAFDPPIPTTGDVHALLNYENSVILHKTLLSQTMQEIRNTYGKLPADAFRLGSEAARDLRKRNGDLTENAIVAYNRCTNGQARKDFMQTLFAWKPTALEAKKLILADKEAIKLKP